MANPTCAPFTDVPLFVTDVPDQELLEATQKAMADDVRMPKNGNKRFDNSDLANIGRMGQQFVQMSGMDLPEIETYLTKQLIKFGKDPNTKDYAPILKSNILGATQAHWERRAAGVQRMARSYIAQRAEGQEPIAQAAEFLRQLKSFNELGREIAKDNLTAGAALRQKKLAKEMSFAADDTFQGAVGNKTFTPEYLEGVKDNLSYYKQFRS